MVNSNLIRLPLDYEGEPQLAKIRISLPSLVPADAGGCVVEAGIELLDSYGFHLPNFTTQLELKLEGGPGETPGEFLMQAEDHSHRRVKIALMEPDRVYRLLVTDKKSNISGLSNPCLTKQELYEADYKLYWGDLHAHRLEIPRIKAADPLLRSYGPATVEEFYRFARDVVFLDFAALTDHDYALTVDEWRQIQEGAVYFNQPDRFVSFLGYEWGWNTGVSADHGHRHILFKHDDMPLISASWANSNTPRDLFKTLSAISDNDTDFLSIPHHSARLSHQIWYNWDSHNKDFERLIEIHSMWGSSERQDSEFPLLNHETISGKSIFEALGHFVQDGLAMGHRVGFVGGSESHDGRAAYPAQHGNQRLIDVSFLYKPGLTGIWARRKTRPELWGGLWQRRTLATTGARIFLDMTIDSHGLGAHLKTHSPPKRLALEAHGTGAIDHIVVIRNNQVWHKIEDPGWDVEEIIFDLPLPDETDWYYLRLIQKDGQAAWTSPIWVTGNKRGYQ